LLACSTTSLSWLELKACCLLALKSEKTAFTMLLLQLLPVLLLVT
jgi:hypothetical protein